MEFLAPELEAYVNEHTQEETALLKDLERETWLKVINPRMLAGHLQGRVLSMFSHMLKPKRILEIGTYTGFSSICWAEGLAEGGLIHTIDINEELETMIRKYHDKAGISDKVKLHFGDALDIIPQLNETWDIVFIDADKSNYNIYFDLVIDSVRPGGFIIADNVLWSGKVFQNMENEDADTAALKIFNKRITTDNRVENVLLPIRDGLMVARKL
jgi:predicted O-methyltransferase YrrM